MTEKQKTAALIFNKISGAYTLSTIYIKNKGLTNREIAQVGEHLSDLPGVGLLKLVSTYQIYQVLVLVRTGKDHIQMVHQSKVSLAQFQLKNLVCQVIICNIT